MSAATPVQAPQGREVAPPPLPVPSWVANATLLWNNRRVLVRTAIVSFVLALVLACLLPRRYESSARIMTPMNSMGGAVLLSALAGHGNSALGNVGALAGGLLGGGNTALFIDLLRSGTVSSHLIDRFDLQRIYAKRYRIDTAKALARRTHIQDDKRSGVITLTVTDTDPVRARDLAQAYLDELNQLVTRTNTSTAHQERLFIEKRLSGVHEDLDRAQQSLSDFSSTHATFDLKEQTRAVVDAASRLQAELIVEESGLRSLEQTYGDGNVRVRSAQARIALLQSEIAKMNGSSTPLGSSSAGGESPAIPAGEATPPLRQLPRLAVPYANLYREVKVQEDIYELLTQQYEIARIQEAKDVPVVSIIDAPGIPEKKSFPPRALLTLALTLASVAAASVFLLARARWRLIPPDQPAKVLALHIGATLRQPFLRWIPRHGGVQ